MVSRHNFRSWRNWDRSICSKTINASCIYAYVGGNPISRIDPLGLAGFGIIGGGEAEIERAALNEAYAYQAASGVGVFLPYGGNNLELEAFTSSGGGHIKNNGGAVCRQHQEVIGASAGLGTGLFLTNANDRNDLLGPFDTTSLNTPFFSIQYATSGNTWFVSFLVGPTLGLSISRYAVTTTNVLGH